MVGMLEVDKSQETGGGIDMAKESPILNSDDVYREAVNILLQLRSTKEIRNDTHAHAAILFEAFFRHADERVRIFCKNLNDEVFGNERVVEAAVNALKKRTSIDILIQETEPAEGRFAEFLEANKENPLLRLKRATKDKTRNSPFNFCVMDDRALRFEENREEVKAFVIMYAPELALKLVEKFQQLFARAETINTHTGNIPAHA